MSESRPAPASSVATPPERDARFDIAIVDQSQDAIDAARDAAEVRLTEELNSEGGRIRRFIRNIWKGNHAKEIYRQRYIAEAAKTIHETQDQFAHLDADESQKTNARVATIDRMLQGHDEAIHQEAGENREVLDDGSAIASATKDLVRRYASGDLDEDALKEEQSRLLEAYRATHDGVDELRRCSVQVHNITDVARAVKGAVEHGESLDQIIQDMRVVDGTERSGARTEHMQTLTDRTIEKLGKSKLGRLSFLTPEMTVTAVAVASSAVRVGATMGLGNALKVVAPGIAGGVIAGLRESRHVRKERIQSAREAAQGGERRDSDTRREEMETTLYETRSAVDEAANIREALGLEAFENNDIAAVHDVMMRVAELQERRRISDVDKKDLLSFSSAIAMGAERHDLDMALVEAKMALAHKLAIDDVQNGLRSSFGAEPHDLLAAAREGHSALIEQDVTEKDKLYSKLRRKRVTQKVAVGVALGATLGIATQEAMAAIQPNIGGIADNFTGQKTDLHGGKSHYTLLGRMFNTDQSSGGDTHAVAAGAGKFDVTGGTADIKNGMMTIDAHGRTVEVPVGINGQLSDAAREQLQGQGINVGESKAVPVNIPTTKHVNMSPDKFLEHYGDKTSHVVRDFWYDNNTPSPNFDLNEQGLHLAGENGTGIGPDGHVQLTVAPMTSEGSFHSGQSIEWQKAAESGNLKFAISATENTQKQPFMLSIKPDGSIDIPKDHPAAQLFSEVDGRMQFNGAYGEVVQSAGVDTNGIEHIRPLATMVGTKEWPGGPVDIPGTEPGTAYITSIDVPNETVTELPPIVPVPLSRKSMEQLKGPEAPYYTAYERTSPEEWRAFRKEISPRLRRDPQAILSPRDELKWYRGDIEKRKGKEYLRDIDAQIAASPELSNPAEDLRAIVTVPVHGSGEADNIYKTLSLYNQQTEEKGKFMVMLHVNWFDSEELDVEKKANIHKTLSEIERARQDFPDLAIATIQSVWEQEKKDRGEYGNGIIGHVTRKMYDAAMMTVEGAMQQGRIENQDVLLIRNDADAEGMDRRYVSQMINNMESHPDSDVFTGAIRWGTERHSDLPGFAFVSNFREVMHIATHRKGISEWPPTVGINTAVRMSTFAAVGGVGSDPDNTGIGSDDLNIGGRVKDARQPGDGGPRTRSYMRYGSARFKNIRRRLRDSPAETDSGYTGRSGEGNYSYHRHVVGATIDTSPDRLEAAYLDPRVESTSDAWANWDNKQRSVGVAELRKQHKESLRSNPAAIVSHVEADLSKSITERFKNSAHVAAGLAMMLPVEIDGQPSYRISATRSGSKRFEFTDEGRQWFMHRLARDSKGRYDPIGRRVRRQKYHEGVRGRRLATKIAPYVK